MYTTLLCVAWIGRVYKASYQGSPVAAKIMNDTRDLDEAFQKEVEILVQLMHPNILR
jgi:hypothetical protein